MFLSPQKSAPDVSFWFLSDGNAGTFNKVANVHDHRLRRLRGLDIFLNGCNTDAQAATTEPTRGQNEVRIVKLTAAHRGRSRSAATENRRLHRREEITSRIVDTRCHRNRNKNKIGRFIADSPDYCHVSRDVTPSDFRLSEDREEPGGRAVRERRRMLYSRSAHGNPR